MDIKELFRSYLALNQEEHSPRIKTQWFLRNRQNRLACLQAEPVWRTFVLTFQDYCWIRDRHFPWIYKTNRLQSLIGTFTPETIASIIAELTMRQERARQNEAIDDMDDQNYEEDPDEDRMEFSEFDDKLSVEEWL